MSLSAQIRRHCFHVCSLVEFRLSTCFISKCKYALKERLITDIWERYTFSLQNDIILLRYYFWWTNDCCHSAQYQSHLLEVMHEGSTIHICEPFGSLDTVLWSDLLHHLVERSISDSLYPTPLRPVYFVSIWLWSWNAALNLSRWDIFSTIIFHLLMFRSCFTTGKYSAMFSTVYSLMGVI